MKDNKIIAEFMGLENVGTLNNPMFEYGEDGGCRSLEDLDYHTSWDWLMPVVKKIESLNYDVQIGGGMMARIVDIDLDRTKVMKEIEVSYPTKLETTYKAVVEFINEYNKQEFDEGHQSSVMFGVDNNQEL